MRSSQILLSIILFILIYNIIFILSDNILKYYFMNFGSGCFVDKLWIDCSEVVLTSMLYSSIVAFILWIPITYYLSKKIFSKK